jgi:hypothetical protein
MMTGIQHMVRDIMYAQENGAELGSVNEANYQEWQKIYTWEALVGQRYGQSFCNHFDISDNILYYTTFDVGQCDEYIMKRYIEPAP